METFRERGGPISRVRVALAAAFLLVPGPAWASREPASPATACGTDDDCEGRDLCLDGRCVPRLMASGGEELLLAGGGLAVGGALLVTVGMISGLRSDSLGDGSLDVAVSLVVTGSVLLGCSVALFIAGGVLRTRRKRIESGRSGAWMVAPVLDPVRGSVGMGLVLAF